MTFESLGLAPALLRALDEQGYTAPTPIQAAAIPEVLAGHDLLGGAQTGTGKTAAFALPLLQKIGVDEAAAGRSGQRARHPRALILTPTRELAAQIHDNLRAYGKYVNVRTMMVFGGVAMGGQIKALQRGTDVIVATPGRLIDHMGRGNVNLSHVQTLVLDEADRMLDMGFKPALQKILAALPTDSRQTLLFSATFASEVKALAAQFTRAPKEVQVAPSNAIAAGVEHRMHPVDAERKRELLLHLLAPGDMQPALVFARTKHGSDKLCKFLDKHGLRAAAIHGNKSQNQRTRALADFKSGKVSVVVATDIAARGLDIPQLPTVVNYDLPLVAEDYVHRIGRTGRAGASGLALSLVGRDEEGLLREINRLLKGEITVEPVAGFEPEWQPNLAANARSPHKRGGKAANTRRGKRPNPRASGKPSRPRRARAQAAGGDQAATGKRDRKRRGNGAARGA